MVAKRLGEAVTYTDSASDVSETRCVLRRNSEPILIGGQIQIAEDHYEGLVPVADLALEPAIGDTLETNDATQYRVDVPPVRDAAMWRLTLRRL
jgi:hypothetical protein